MATKANKSGKKPLTKKEQQKRKIMIIAAEVICLVVLGIVVFAWSFLGKIDYSNFGEDEAGINNDLSDESKEILENYTNIAIFGLDNRSEGDYDTGHSDVIMIASINNETKEAKLLSVYRDTLLHVGDDQYQKANSAYA